MKRNLSLFVLLALLLGALAAACSSTAKAPDLNGTEWQLTSLNGSLLPENIHITLRFEEGQAGGTAACNGYGAAYSQDGTDLTFDQMMSTEMWCEGVMDYEANYLAALSLAKSFQLENNVLSLLDENRAVILVFGLPQPIPEASDTLPPTADLPVLSATLPPAIELPMPTSLPALLAGQVQNSTYRLNIDPRGLEVQLTDGQYQSTDPNDPIYVSMSEVMGLGDIDGDGLGDAAAIVGENYGGSGVFVSLVIYLLEGGMPVQAQAAAIDDRPNIQAVSIQDGQVIVEGLIHGFSDPGCCPSMPVIRTYRLVGESLVLLQQIQVLEDGRQRAITITTPAQGSQAADSVRLTGEVTISPFENNLVYILYDAQNNELERGPFAVTSDGMGGPGTFDNTISLGSVPAGQVFRIELQDNSMADGSILALAAVVLYR